MFKHVCSLSSLPLTSCSVMIRFRTVVVVVVEMMASRLSSSKQMLCEVERLTLAVFTCGNREPQQPVSPQHPR